MRPLLVLVLAASACDFSGPGQPVDAQVDAPPDTPPPLPGVSFTSVTVNQTTIRPGLYGIEVMTVLRNGHTSPITGIRASLTFLESTTDRAADFRWRDADARDGVMAAQPVTIAPGGEETFRFRLDALASAAPSGPILVNGSAQFETDGRTYAATPLDPPANLAFDDLLPPPIVVNIVTDESNSNNTTTSFREALEQALLNPGFDRIVFDQTVFPPGVARDILLDTIRDQLPVITGDVTVIDGGTSNVTIAVDAAWDAPTGRSGLRLAGGTLVVHGLGFRDFAFGYQQEDLSLDNCGSGIQRQGGAILVTEGTLILDGNTFSDPGVTERNCYATSVLLAGGSGHRILNNYWTKQAMDSLTIRAPTIEVSDNVMDAGSTAAADLDKTDDCISVETEDNSNVWIVGNVCIDQELSAVVAHGGGTGIIHVVNNTFARNGRIPGMSAVRREVGQRRIELHNNAYHANLPGAIQTDDMNGVNMTISHESAFSLQFCSGCTDAIIDSTVVSGPTAIGLTNPDGATRGDLTPLAGSPLVDSGRDLVDRNGSAPGRFNRAGVDRGAFELP